ncbi:MAG: acyltransferase family protein [Patescibacteria group bacterium]
MIVSINNPVLQTLIFSIFFFLALILMIRKGTDSGSLSINKTQELKGLAILLIVFSHISYFLVSDNNFLWPFSIMAGVGVNLFLFLSGFGLTMSSLKNNLSVWQFYKRRLIKLFIPLWPMLIILFIADFFVLHINYSWQYIGEAMLGITRHADLYQDVNSPLWYLTFILGFYILFPLLFFKKRPWLSAVLIFLAVYFFVDWEPIPFYNVLHLYKVHTVAFPLGILFAWLMTTINLAKFKIAWEKIKPLMREFIYYFSVIVLIGIFVYSVMDSAVGASANREQTMSIISVLALTLIFILKKIDFKFLYLFGIYSYEIYLWHWPLMYRYDFIYRYLPAWLSTLLYLALFLFLGWGFQKIVGLFSGKKEVAVEVKKVEIKN